MASKPWLWSQIDLVYCGCNPRSTSLETYWLSCVTQALAFVQKQTASLLPSSQQKRTVWEWAYRSAAHLLNAMEGGSGLRPILRKAPCFLLRCPYLSEDPHERRTC